MIAYLVIYRVIVIVTTWLLISGIFVLWWPRNTTPKIRPRHIKVLAY